MDDNELDAGPPASARRAWVAGAIALTWLGLYLAGLIAGGGRLGSDHVLTWGSVEPEILVRQGALVPTRVTGGEWQRLLTGSAVVGQGALSLALALWIFLSAGRALERLTGSARMLIVVLVAALAGACARMALVPDSRLTHFAGWDLLLGTVGARIPLGLAIGGPPGRTLVSGALAFLVLSALLAYALPGTPTSHLVGEGVGFVAGGLTLALLGARRAAAPPGPLVRGVAFLALALVLGAAGWQVKSALGSGSDPALRGLLDELEATEQVARRLWKASNPERVPPTERALLGARLDLLAGSDLLEGLEGQEALRAYLQALRPLATGELRDPTAVLPRLKAGYAAWAPHEDRLRRRLGLFTRAVPPWR